MSDPVRVSVVIPVHNAERFIGQAIRSVLDSDLQDFEIIAIDDGSRDRSAEIVRQIADPRYYCCNRASGTPAHPRNVGVAHARAPYVAFLDADDLLRRAKLSSAVTTLDNHPEAGFAFAEFEHIDGDGRVLASVLAFKISACAIVSKKVEGSWHLIEQAEMARGLLQRNFIGTSGVVVRKRVFEEVGGFDEGLVYSEDLDLWFRLAHRYSALYSDDVGHSYRLAPGSLTYKPSVRTASDRVTVLRREKRRRALKSERRQLDRLIAESLGTIGYEHRRNRKRLPSIAAFAQALVANPDVRWVRALMGSLVS